MRAEASRVGFQQINIGHASDCFSSQLSNDALSVFARER
jgi:hypothetical protein